MPLPTSPEATESIHPALSKLLAQLAPLDLIGLSDTHPAPRFEP